MAKGKVVDPALEPKVLGKNVNIPNPHETETKAL